MMRLSGKDVWQVGWKMGWASGSYDPRSNPIAAPADKMASLLNDAIGRQADWLPDLIDSEDAMRTWEANTPREKVLRLYKFLNQIGYTVIGIDAANRAREDQERVSGFAQKGEPLIYLDRIGSATCLSVFLLMQHRKLHRELRSS